MSAVPKKATSHSRIFIRKVLYWYIVYRYITLHYILWLQYSCKNILYFTYIILNCTLLFDTTPFSLDVPV